MSSRTGAQPTVDRQRLRFQRQLLAIRTSIGRHCGHRAANCPLLAIPRAVTSWMRRRSEPGSAPQADTDTFKISSPDSNKGRHSAQRTGLACRVRVCAHAHAPHGSAEARTATTRAVHRAALHSGQQRPDRGPSLAAGAVVLGSAQERRSWGPPRSQCGAAHLSHPSESSIRVSVLVRLGPGEALPMWGAVGRLARTRRFARCGDSLQQGAPVVLANSTKRPDSRSGSRAGALCAQCGAAPLGHGRRSVASVEALLSGQQRRGRPDRGPGGRAVRSRAPEEGSDG